MIHRALLFALSRGIEEGGFEAAHQAIRPYDPLLRPLIRRRLRSALDEAGRLTTAQQTHHILRLAMLLVAKNGIFDAPSNEVDAVAREAASLGAPAPPLRGPWLTIGMAFAVLLAGAAAITLAILAQPFDPRTSDEGILLTETVPSFVVAVANGSDEEADQAQREATGGLAREALGDEAAERLEDLLEATRALARNGTQAARDGYYDCGTAFNAALHSQQLPYYVDTHTITRKGELTPILLSFYIEREMLAEAGSTTVRAVHLWRLDRLNLRQGYLGYTRPRTPEALVLLDQIETDLVRYVLPAVPAGEPMSLLDEAAEAEPWAQQLGARAGDRIRRYIATLPEQEVASIARVGLLLARRRALVRQWRETAKGLDFDLRIPQRLIPEADYAADLLHRVPRLDLHEWEDIHEQLLEADNLAAFSLVRERYVASVQRHEVQHRLDHEAGGLGHGGDSSGAFGAEESLRARSREELSAYLASIAHADGSPLLDLVLLARFVFDREGWGDPYHHAALAIYRGLAQELGVDEAGRRGPAGLVALFTNVTAQDDDALRSAAAQLYVSSFGRELPRVSTKLLAQHPSWRH